jgi:hypothetical protein
VTLVARITFLVLVGATFAAFFVAQRLKSSPPVIRVASLNRAFSPALHPNRFSVTLKTTDDVTVDVVDLDGDRVKRLAEDVRAIAHRPLRLVWDGTTDSGARAADGQYRIRVSLRNEGRSTVIQHTITLDTKPPHPVVCVGTPCNSKKPLTGNIIAPSKGPVRIYVRGVSRAYITRLKVFRTDDGRPEQVAAFNLPRGKRVASWAGSSALAPGTYLIQATVRDRAGNFGTTPTAFEPGAVPGRPGLTVRGLAVQPPLRPVTAGQKASFSVDARGAKYLWRMRRAGEGAVRGRGRGTGPDLAVPTPSGAPSGAYILEVTSGRWHVSVPFLAQSQRKSSVLVVVPAVSWLGADDVDDEPLDGLPNTLANGSTVHWPRVFTGLPPQFSDDAAKLLVFLDRRRIRYDLTSDLDLDLTGNLRATDREGVLLAGPETWVTPSLSKRLRRYVLDGGRVATIGADSLRRGVTLRADEAGDAGELASPTQPTAVDPFGDRLTKLRTLSQPVSLIQLEGDDQSLMTGVESLPGFTQLEESLPVSGQRKLLTGVGQALTPQEEAAAQSSGKPARELRPALSAVQVGAKKGLVIRVGLPEWYAKLGTPQVAQATQNVIDLLRGVTPKIRTAR